MSVAFCLLTRFFDLPDDNGVQVMPAVGGGVLGVGGGTGDGLLQLYARAHVVQIPRAGSSLRPSGAGQRRQSPGRIGHRVDAQPAEVTGGAGRGNSRSAGPAASRGQHKDNGMCLIPSPVLKFKFGIFC